MSDQNPNFAEAPKSPLVCSDCKRSEGDQHRPSCHRQGIVSRESDYGNQPDSQPASQQDPAGPRRRTRRHVPPYTEVLERRFWETCVQIAMQIGTARDAVNQADQALAAWRERWAEKKEAAKPAHVEADFLDFAPPPLAGYSDYKPVEHPFEPTEGNRYCRNCGAGRLHAIHTEFAPPINTATAPHVFEALTEKSYCGVCGAGRLHPIHVEDTPTE